MAAKYLLPCNCGKDHVVEPRQAGQTILCGCGDTLIAPTLMEMRLLEPAPTAAPTGPSTTSWGHRNGLRLVGIVLLFLGVGGEIWLYLHTPTSRFDVIDPELVQAPYKSLPAVRTWDVWQQWKQGLDRRIDQQYAAALQQFRIFQAAVGGIAVAGAGLILASMLGPRRPAVRGPAKTG